MADLAAFTAQHGALQVHARWPARGRIAGLGYQQATFSEGELLLLNGPHMFGMLWHALSSFSVFTRLPI